ncbi:MAG: ARPP-1 family domain-containing protein, partial [Chromatiales bacterium]
MTIVAKALEGITLGEPVRHLSLTMYPLLKEAAGEPDYLTLDEALNLGQVEVTEISEAGHVPELKLKNGADKPVLLLDGEELVGAKQDRVINLSILVPAQSTLTIPVACVEAGRWHHNSPRFVASKRTVFAEMRAAKAASVSESLRTSARRAANQGEVWDCIAEKSSRMEALSQTSALADVFGKYESNLESYEKAMKPLAHQAGAVFAINGDSKGVDLFDHPATLAKLLPKLVQSYALDAIDLAQEADQQPASTTGSATRFLAALKNSAVERYPAVGLGEDLRLSGDCLVGGVLAHQERVVHLCA